MVKGNGPARPRCKHGRFGRVVLMVTDRRGTLLGKVALCRECLAMRSIQLALDLLGIELEDAA